MGGIMRHAVGAQFLLFLGLHGQEMDEDNWDALRTVSIMTPYEIEELQQWKGSPTFYLPILKLATTARMALECAPLSRSLYGTYGSTSANSRSPPPTFGHHYEAQTSNRSGSSSSSSMDRPRSDVVGE